MPTAAPSPDPVPALADGDDDDETRRQRTRGVFYMLASAVGFSVMGLLVKLASSTFPAMELVFARSTFMAVLTFAAIRREGISALGVDRWTLSVRGAVGALSLSLFYIGIGRLPLGDAVTIQYTAPIWTALIAAPLLGERLRPVVFVSAALSLGGVVLVARPSVLFGTGLALDGWGVAAVAAAAVMSGFVYTLVRKLRATDRPMTIIFYLSWIGAVGSLPFALGGGWAIPSGWDWTLLLGIGLATHVGQLGLTEGMHRLEAGTASSIGYLQVVLAFVWGAVVLGDSIDGLSVVGAAIVVASVGLTVGSGPVGATRRRSR